MAVRTDELSEIAREVEEETGYDSVVICAGDSEENRVNYGFERGEDQTFREIVGTVSTCLHLMFQDHFFRNYLSAHLPDSDSDNG